MGSSLSNIKAKGGMGIVGYAKLSIKTCSHLSLLILDASNKGDVTYLNSPWTSVLEEDLRAHLVLSLC